MPASFRWPILRLPRLNLARSRSPNHHNCQALLVLVLLDGRDSRFEGFQRSESSSAGHVPLTRKRYRPI
jgi:hypothetical protein